VDDSWADAVVLFGPLYHLVERADRMAALGEARRVLRSGGRLLAVGISRFASALDGLARGFLEDSAFAAIVEQDLRNGQHRNPTGRIDYFTDAYFHRPGELRAEVEETGFEDCELLAVDLLGYAARDLDRLWRDETLRERVLHILRTIESEPTLLGASPHLMAVARRP
jgi:SAM-dependent methyltransferase